MSTTLSQQATDSRNTAPTRTGRPLEFL
ncbi:chemotaxis protein CheW, partial [Variovorax beijingensis]